MATRAIHPDLVTSLMNYDPFRVVHLIRFEKPQNPDIVGALIKGVDSDYTFITDAPFDIVYDDGAVDLDGNPLTPTGTDGNIYRANKLVNLGTVNENIQARASNLSMTLDASSLGTIVDVAATFTSVNGKMVTTTNLSELGFQEGDKIFLNKTGSTGNLALDLQTHDNAGKYIRIESFTDEGKSITFTDINGMTAVATAKNYTIALAAEELNILIADKTGGTYTNYINREVFIYRAHLNSENVIIGTPYVYFKGITSGCSIVEKPNSSQIKWTLSSHWGDFLRVQGRLTDDEEHRALQPDNTVDIASVLRPAYASDLGFLHANRAINVLATYNVKVDKIRTARGDDLQEYTEDETREVDLRFNPQAKMLPVVYGVRKIDSFPIFVDTDKSDASIVYKADALCEGPIASIFDILIDDTTTICVNKLDFDLRSVESDAVELQCFGRQDRGDTLNSYDSATGNVTQFDYNGVTIETTLGPNAPFNSDSFTKTVFQTTPTGASDSETGNATGILHERTHSFIDPMNVHITFHAGKANQKADNTLVEIANNPSDSNFTTQDPIYYAGKELYWGPSHQVLDTAYVAGKYVIKEGETSLPSMSYVVRGRNPECYNYDGSYKQSTESNLTNAIHTQFNLNDSVTLHKTSGNGAIGSTFTIVDKWSTFDINGDIDYRFRLSPRLSPSILLDGTTPITNFYMKKSNNARWHMQTWDAAETSTIVAEALVITGMVASQFVQSSNGIGTKLVVSGTGNTPERYALNQPGVIIGMYNAADISAAAPSYAGFSFNTSTQTIDNIPLPYSASYGTANNITGLYIKNAIALNGAANQAVANFYVGKKVTLQHAISGGGVFKQERTIISYDNTYGVAMVDEPWAYNFMPALGDKFTIGSIGDKRVTINPAMQLLDYLTNERYGKGLDIDKDIDVSSFLSAARECDTRSEVTVLITPGANINVGETYEMSTSSGSTTINQFRGTVSRVETDAELGSAFGTTGPFNWKQVTFTDCVGKVATKWNNWKYFQAGEFYWYDKCFYRASSAGVITTTPNPQDGNKYTSTVYLRQVGGSKVYGISKDNVYSANGNPIVKKWDSRASNFSASGYGIYDSDDVKYWKYLGWDSSEQRNVTRHQMNQIVDTQSPIFSNINKMLKQFNGMLRYSVGKYELDIKSKKPTLVDPERISEDDIIGTIKLADKGLKNSKNYVTASILDPANGFQARTVSFFNSDYLKEDKGIQKKAQYSLPGVTNYFNARFNIKQFLDESRYGLEIQFTMAPRGLLLLSGNIIDITYPRFGYTNKSFRITNINFKNDGLVDITASEHDDSAYVIVAEGGGYGIAPDPNTPPLGRPNPPTNLAASQVQLGEIILVWNNTDAFSETTHEIEIWRGNSINFLGAPAPFNANNTTIVEADRAKRIGSCRVEEFRDSYTENESTDPTLRYYWIRYQVKTPSNRAGSRFINVASVYEPRSNLAGVPGLALGMNTNRLVSVSAGTTLFQYNTATSRVTNPATGQTTVTALPVNISDEANVEYTWVLKDASGTALSYPGSGQTGSSDTYIYSPPTEALQNSGGRGQASGTLANLPQTLDVSFTDTINSGLSNQQIFTSNTASISFAGVRTVINGSIGADGQTYTPTNGTHNFAADATGAITDVASFSSFIRVFDGTDVLVYKPQSTATDGFSLGPGFDSILPAAVGGQASVLPVLDQSNGKITISAASGSGSFLTNPAVNQVSFQIDVFDNSIGHALDTNPPAIPTAVFEFNLTKSLDASAVRGGSIFTFETSSTAQIDATSAAKWAGTLDNAAAAAVAGAVIAASPDNTLRQNDRITVTDNSNEIAGTRIYAGTSAVTSAASVQASSFSSLVVETFDGSVIVTGTLSGNRLAANTVLTNELVVGNKIKLGTSSSNLSGIFHTAGKNYYADTDSGFFLQNVPTTAAQTAIGLDDAGNQFPVGVRLNLGGAQNFVKWDGFGLEVAGTISLSPLSTYESQTGNNTITTLPIGNIVGQLDNLADDEKITPSEAVAAYALWEAELTRHTQIIDDWANAGTPYFWDDYDAYVDVNGVSQPAYDHDVDEDIRTPGGAVIASNGVRKAEEKLYQLQVYLGIRVGFVWYNGPATNTNSTPGQPGGSTPVNLGTIGTTYGPLQSLTNTYDLSYNSGEITVGQGANPVNGATYKISEVGTTNWGQLGLSTSAFAGATFTANSTTATGTGKAFKNTPRNGSDLINTVGDTGRTLWNRMWEECYQARKGLRNALEYHRQNKIDENNALVSDISSDNKITPSEKQQLKLLQKEIIDMHSTIQTNATEAIGDIGGITFVDYFITLAQQAINAGTGGATGVATNQALIAGLTIEDDKSAYDTAYNLWNRFTTFPIGVSIALDASQLNLTTTLGTPISNNTSVNPRFNHSRASWDALWANLYEARAQLIKSTQYLNNFITSIADGRAIAAAKTAGTAHVNLVSSAEVNQYGMVVFSGNTKRVKIGDLVNL